MSFDLNALTQKTRGFLKTAGVKAKKTAGEMKDRADRAAEAVAAKCTELTGRETTASEVKKAAIVIAGVAVLGGIGLSALTGDEATAVAGLTDIGVGDVGGSSGMSFGNDFEDLAVQTFAEGGHSLNFYTPHVDSCGTIYSGPNG
jgi:hypothetical protein